MDAIDTFLDTMFAPYPAVPRLIGAKAELRAMMEEAYNNAIASGRTHNEAVGQVIAEYGDLERMAPTLGIESALIPGDAVAQDAPRSSARGSASGAAPAASSTGTMPMGVPLREQEEDKRLSAGALSAIYWPAVAIIFLAWSFLADAWSVSWIIWPIAALIYQILWYLVGTKRDRSRR